MLIVITGKGGVGKTMISALLVKCIAELKAKDENILAVDADPASNFANALGIKAIGSVGDIREDIRKMLDKGTFPLTDKEMYFHLASFGDLKFLTKFKMTERYLQ